MARAKSQTKKELKEKPVKPQKPKMPARPQGAGTSPSIAKKYKEDCEKLRDQYKKDLDKYKKDLAAYKQQPKEAKGYLSGAEAAKKAVRKLK